MFNPHIKFEVSCLYNYLQRRYERQRLRGNAQRTSMARWKARWRLPINANWTFLPALTVEALWADIGRHRCVR